MAFPPRPWRATQPIKALCISYFVLSTPPWLLFLLIKFSFRSLRPNPQLGVKANINNVLIKALFTMMTGTRSPDFAADRIKAAGVRAVTVKPAPAGLYTGVIAATSKIKPADRVAIWFPSAPPGDKAAAKKEKVVLHLPGGAFVAQLGHESLGRKAADVVLKHSSADRFIWAQYRLASTPGDVFPASIQDAVTFYSYVLSLGYEPSNVIIAGDSAGGNVAIALLRYLESTSALPLPRAVLAWSPWVEVTRQAGRAYSEVNTAQTDLLTPEFLQWGADAYRPRGNVSKEVEGYVSPLHHPFTTSVPLFLHGGEGEAFCPSIRRFAEEMEEVNGSKIRFHSTPLALHDLILCWEPWGMEKEAGAAVKDAWELFYE